MKEAPDEVEEFPEQLAREHLPKTLQDTCIVLPKRLFQWGAFNVMLIGMGLGMLLASVLADFVSISWVAYGFPLCLGAAWLVSHFILKKEENKFYEDVIREGGDGASD